MANNTSQLGLMQLGNITLGFHEDGSTPPPVTVTIDMWEYILPQPPILEFTVKPY